MSSEFASLTVRQNRRREIAIAAHIAVTKEHAEIVRLAPGAATRAGWFDATVVDASEGGLGFVSELFVPRGCMVKVDIRNPLNTDESLLVAGMRIKRVQMIDRRPGYLIGGVFESNTDDFHARLTGFLASIDGPDAG
jgi:hypothetical protein